jgi:hypothetical protein
LSKREVGLVLDANIEAINKLFMQYARKALGKIAFASLCEMILWDSKLKDRMTLSATKFCYGMSLMTNPDLVRNTNTHMQHISFVEFCEFIVRMADIYF